MAPVSFFIFLWSAFSSIAAKPPDDTHAYRDGLISSALKSRLFDDPYWLLLGHYQPRWSGGYRSMIDDPLFFFDPHGKVDPRAELTATIAAFFEPAPDDPETRHPVCRFPARLAWLKEKLGIDPQRLPVPECEILNSVYAIMRPSSLTMIFPAAFMNSPASMFGHTLLVFDADDKNRLLSKGVGYAADVRTAFGPLFALQGIFGMCQGRYNIESYFEKVEQYNDINRRDIWEYELDFTREEVMRVFLHTWELQNIWSWYYFFDENCAFKLYQLLDAARPDLKLSRHQPLFIIPIDTIKLINSKGLVRKTEFRPSKATRMLQIADRLDDKTLEKSLQTARGTLPPADLAGDDSIPLAERRLSLDLSADYAQYLYTEKVLDQGKYSRRYLDILRARSKLGVREDVDFEITTRSHPEDGHAASLLAPGVSVENGDVSLSLSARAAYHSLFDNDTGFERGAQILLLNSEFRWQPDDDDIEIRFLDFIHIESIAPRNELFSPSSWRVRVGFTQMDRRPDQDSLIFSTQTGTGYAWEPGSDHLIFAMVEAEVHAGDRYSSFLAGGPGSSIGWIYSINERLKWLNRIRGAWIYESDDDWWRAEGVSGLDIKWSQQRSIRLYYQYTRNDDFDINEANASMNFYF